MSIKNLYQIPANGTSETRNGEYDFSVNCSDFFSFHFPFRPFSRLRLLGAIFVFFVFCQINFAQADEEPPPIKILSKDEKSQLNAETDVKRRTKLSLDLMEARLVKAETFGTAENYPAMYAELGGFHALMDNTVNFLSNSDRDSGKVLNNFKRVELNLRKYISRLELIRRELPVRYEPYVRKLTKYVREARSRAVEPLFDDTVVPNNKPENNE